MAIDSYLNNITSQHRDKPKFISWLSKNLTIVDDAYLCLKSMDLNFDIDNAIGTQLDILGKIVGRERLLTFQPLNGNNPLLDDDLFRTVLKANIAMNNWDGSRPQIFDIWDNIFDDIKLKLQDNQDMSFNAYISGYVDQSSQDLIQKGYIVPKPAGVMVNYIGNSDIESTLYIGMLVSVSKCETVKMNFNPETKISLTGYSRLAIQQIKTETIHLKGGK